MTEITILADRLRQGIVSFTYRKKDGEIRHAVGTRKGVEHTIKGTGTARESTTTMRYYDIDCKGWRSFIIANLINVGEVRMESVEQHHEICLALVVELKKKMQTTGTTSFAYRKTDGTIRYAHGTIASGFSNDGEFFVYFDTDKGEERKFRIDAFIGFGEEEDLAEDIIFAFDATSARPTASATASIHTDSCDLSSLNIKAILAKKGIDTEDVENICVIDLLPELNKEQLKDLIIRATTRLAEL